MRQLDDFTTTDAELKSQVSRSARTIHGIILPKMIAHTIGAGDLC